MRDSAYREPIAPYYSMKKNDQAFPKSREHHANLGSKETHDSLNSLNIMNEFEIILFPLQHVNNKLNLPLHQLTDLNQLLDSALFPSGHPWE